MCCCRLSSANNFQTIGTRLNISEISSNNAILLSKFYAILFQKEISWPIFRGDLVYKLRGRPFDPEMGGGGVGLANFVGTDYLFSSRAWTENLFSGKPRTEN